MAKKTKYRVAMAVDQTLTDQPLEPQAIATLQENSLPAKKQEDCLIIDCPNCRAQAGQPCKWTDGSTCQARKNVYLLSHPEKENAAD